MRVVQIDRVVGEGKGDAGGRRRPGPALPCSSCAILLLSVAKPYSKRHDLPCFTAASPQVQEKEDTFKQTRIDALFGAAVVSTARGRLGQGAVNAGEEG